MGSRNGPLTEEEMTKADAILDAAGVGRKRESARAA